MIRVLLAVAMLLLAPVAALAQSSPGFTYGQVPTAGQWNSYFAAKQDVLGYTPVNRAGDTMTGPLVTTQSTTAASGFNVQPGTAPAAPNDGDIWLDSTGLYYRANGTTIGPTGAGTVSSVTCGAGLTGGTITTTGTCALSAPVSAADGGTGITSLSAGIATWLGTANSANLRAALTDETGTGLAYFQNGALGTPSSGTATNLTGLPTTGLTGTLQAAQFPALTGNVTTTAGSLATTIANNAVTNAKLATATTGTIKSNISGSTTTPSDNTLSAILDNILGSAQGDIIYRGASGWTVLTPGSSGQVLQSGGAAANPSWFTVSGTGTVTSVGCGTGLTGGTITTTGTCAVSYGTASGTAAQGNDSRITGSVQQGTTSTLTVGYTLTPNNIGTVSSGTTTLNCALGNYQYMTNNGAFTLAAPSSDCAADILITNGASAGAITFSGFTVGANTGDSFDTTSGDKFLLTIVRINGTSTWSNRALQ